MTKTEIKAAVLAKLEAKHGVGAVSIYANGSIFSKGINLGWLRDFSKEFEQTADQKNEQQMMNTGYGLYD